MSGPQGSGARLSKFLHSMSTQIPVCVFQMAHLIAVFDKSVADVGLALHRVL